MSSLARPDSLARETARGMAREEHGVPTRGESGAVQHCEEGPGTPRGPVESSQLQVESFG